MDDILFEENHCTKPSVIELGSLFTQCANYFALYALALEWTFKTTEKLTKKKKQLKFMSVYVLKYTNMILSLCASYYYLIVPDSPIKLLKTGKFNKSNVMIGFTRDDGTVFANGFPG